ncbi:MAG: hypothetical protein AAB579_01990 [Patescibacteria group bacterium]
MKRFAFILLAVVSLSWMGDALAGGFPLDEEAVIYRHPNGAVVYIMGLSEWLASIYRGLEYRGFRQNGTASPGHSPQEKRYCMIPLQYLLSGKARKQEVPNIHCSGKSTGRVRAFDYQSPHFLRWLFEEVEDMVAIVE